MGDGQYENFSAAKLLEKAREKYHVFHLHIKETHSGSRKHVQDDWILVDSYKNIPDIISKKIIEIQNNSVKSDLLTNNVVKNDSKTETTDNETNIIL